jgi:hypothetical protein
MSQVWPTLPTTVAGTRGGTFDGPHVIAKPPDGLSACETFRACPDCGGDVGAVEDPPSDASSDVDLPPLGGTSNDDDSA